MNYSQSLPLEDKEVVLTFDDCPLPPYTNRVLDVLAENCVKANYFLVGRMARATPIWRGASAPKATPSAPTARTICSASTTRRWTP